MNAAANTIIMTHRHPRHIETTCLHPSCYADPLNVTRVHQLYNER